MSDTALLNVTVEFSGGAELLAKGVKRHAVAVPAGYTLKDLIAHVKNHIITERADLFVQNDSVRPGILVLVNDTDWELLDELAYVLQDRDVVVFISTLHGG